MGETVPETSQVGVTPPATPTAASPSLLSAINGKKTYIIALVTAVYNLVVAFGWLSPHDQTAINGLLVSGIGAAIRHAID